MKNVICRGLTVGYASSCEESKLLNYFSKLINKEPHFKKDLSIYEREREIPYTNFLPKWV